MKKSSEERQSPKPDTNRLIPVVDLGSYNDPYLENCSGMAYRVPAHDGKGCVKLPASMQRLVYENDLTRNPQGEGLIYVCECGRVFSLALARDQNEFSGLDQ